MGEGVIGQGGGEFIQLGGGQARGERVDARFRWQVLRLRRSGRLAPGLALELPGRWAFRL